MRIRWEDGCGDQVSKTGGDSLMAPADVMGCGTTVNLGTGRKDGENEQR